MQPGPSQLNFKEVIAIALAKQVAIAPEFDFPSEEPGNIAGLDLSACIGKKNIYAVYDAQKYQLILYSDKTLPPDVQPLCQGTCYWLPWQSGEVAYASRADITQSDADIVLTSLLSGCRVSIDSTGIAHTAYVPSDKINFASTGPISDQNNSVKRDKALQSKLKRPELSGKVLIKTATIKRQQWLRHNTPIEEKPYELVGDKKQSRATLVIGINNQETIDFYAQQKNFLGWGIDQSVQPYEKLTAWDQRGDPHNRPDVKELPQATRHYYWCRQCPPFNAGPLPPSSYLDAGYWPPATCADMSFPYLVARDDGGTYTLIKQDSAPPKDIGQQTLDYFAELSGQNSCQLADASKKDILAVLQQLYWVIDYQIQRNTGAIWDRHQCDDHFKQLNQYMRYIATRLYRHTTQMQLANFMASLSSLIAMSNLYQRRIKNHSMLIQLMTPIVIDMYSEHLCTANDLVRMAFSHDLHFLLDQPHKLYALLKAGVTIAELEQNPPLLRDDATGLDAAFVLIMAALKGGMPYTELVELRRLDPEKYNALTCPNAQRLYKEGLATWADLALEYQTNPQGFKYLVSDAALTLCVIGNATCEDIIEYVDTNNALDQRCIESFLSGAATLCLYTPYDFARIKQAYQEHKNNQQLRPVRAVLAKNTNVDPLDSFVYLQLLVEQQPQANPAWSRLALNSDRGKNILKMLCLGVSLADLLMIGVMTQDHEQQVADLTSEPVQLAIQAGAAFQDMWELYQHDRAKFTALTLPATAAAFAAHAEFKELVDYYDNNRVAFDRLTTPQAHNYYIENGFVTYRDLKITPDQRYKGCRQ